MPGLRSVRGFLGAFLSECREDEHVEFLVLTRWASMDAIRAFAGPDPEEAVVEPAAIAALIEFDKRVRHYEVLEDVCSG
jgi:heme-degrading monooxygenase HmoA